MELGAHLAAGPHMVHVAMSQYVGAQFHIADLAPDAPDGMTRSRINQHLAHYVNVDRVPRSARQQPDAIGYPLSTRNVITRLIRNRIDHTGAYPNHCG